MLSQTEEVRLKMYNEFKVQFPDGKRFDSRDEIKTAIKAFGKKYNVVFSIRNSHPKKGEFHYICKHGGIKRETILKKHSQKK